MQNNTPLQTLVLIFIIILLFIFCDTTQDVKQDEVQPLSQHDSTLITNYIKTH